MKTAFTTIVEKDDKVNATGLRVPVDAIAALASGKRPKVKVTIGEYTYRSTVAAYGDLYFVPLSAENRKAAGVQAGDALSLAATRLGLVVPAALNATLVQQLVARTGGLGFLNELLPPARDDLSEIALNPDGALWLMKKGARGFEKLDVHPSLDEVWRSVEALLAPMGRAVSEATSSVDAKLPRSPDGLSGARIKIIHPGLAPGAGYPAINVRLFEPKPVLPEQLAAWNMAPQV